MATIMTTSRKRKRRRSNDIGNVVFVVVVVAALLLEENRIDAMFDELYPLYEAAWLDGRLRSFVTLLFM
jgi:hypothetical protein